MKTTDTLVRDIYDLVSSKEIPDGVDLDAAIESFGENIKRLCRNEFQSARRDNRTLRMSNIGRSDRYLWHVQKGTEGETILPHTLIKFLYGHVIEELLLFLTKASGHTVTDEQKLCEVNGIKGHMDCKIDGVVTDVKSASSFAFKKFKDGTLAENDSFGYIDQIKGYAHAEGTREVGWLAMDKQNGHLTYLKYDLDYPQYPSLEGDITDRIDHIKAVVLEEDIPPVCSKPEPDGKSGNMKLPTQCSYCQFKKACYPNLRTFLYSTGPRHLVKVVKEPNVIELGGDDGF